MFCFVNVFLYFLYIIVFFSVLPFGVINDNNNTLLITLHYITGGVVGPSRNSADVRGEEGGRRLSVQRGTTVRPRVELARAGRAPARRGSISLHHQHLPRQEQGRQSPRQRYDASQTAGVAMYFYRARQ